MKHLVAKKKEGLIISTDIRRNAYLIDFTLQIRLVKNKKLIIQDYGMAQIQAKQANQSVYHSK